MGYGLEDDAGWLTWYEKLVSFCYVRYKKWPTPLGWVQYADKRPVWLYKADIGFYRLPQEDASARSQAGQPLPLGDLSCFARLHPLDLVEVDDFPPDLRSTVNGKGEFQTHASFSG